MQRQTFLQHSGPTTKANVIEARPDGRADLLIRLLRSDNSEVGNRRVVLDGTCQDKAEAVAAILAAWETDPTSESTPPEEPVIPPAIQEPPSEPVVNGPAKTAAWNLSFGAGAGAALVGGVAANGILEATTGKRNSHWHLRVGTSAQTARTVDLSSRHANWQHTSFALGVLWRTFGPWPFSLDVGPLLGWATVSGTGYRPNRQQRIFEYGATAGLRLGRSWARWTLWAEGRATAWLLDEKATANSGADSKDLPPFDVSANLGLSLALFP